MFFGHPYKSDGILAGMRWDDLPCTSLALASALLTVEGFWDGLLEASAFHDSVILKQLSTSSHHNDDLIPSVRLVPNPCVIRGASQNDPQTK